MWYLGMEDWTGCLDLRKGKLRTHLFFQRLSCLLSIYTMKLNKKNNFILLEVVCVSEGRQQHLKHVKS